MVPVYIIGDMVFVEKVTPAMDIKVGDIIEYTREDRVITHRTVKIVNNSEGPIYTAKGDNNQSDDPWPITRSQIKGIVKARIPYIGYPSVVVNELVQGKR
jgi:signal peptidase